MFCAVWYDLYNLKNESLQKLKAFNFTKSNTPPWVFFTVLNCTDGQMIPNCATHHIYMHTYT